MTQAIPFDMDDTLVYWPTPPEIVWEKLCCQYVAHSDGITPEKVLEAINRVRGWYWADSERHRTGRLDLNRARRDVVRLALASIGLDDPAVAERIAGGFIADREQTIEMVPGARATLEALKQRGFKLALVTNGGPDLQRAKIEKFSLAPYFRSILIEGEFGCGKPDSRVFRHTLAQINTAPEEAWMVGDDLNRDIAPCRDLGIYALWVDPQGDGLPTQAKARPDRIIRSVAEIPDLL